MTERVRETKKNRDWMTGKKRWRVGKDRNVLDKEKGCLEKIKITKRIRTNVRNTFNQTKQSKNKLLPKWNQ